MSTILQPCGAAGPGAAAGARSHGRVRWQAALAMGLAWSALAATPMAAAQERSAWRRMHEPLEPVQALEPPAAAMAPRSAPGAARPIGADPSAAAASASAGADLSDRRPRQRVKRPRGS